MNFLAHLPKYRIVAFLFGIGILIVLIYYAGVEKIWLIIKQVSPRWIAASIIIYAASWFFRTWRLELFTLHAGKNIRALELFKLYISGYALNILLPAKLGDVATIGYLKWSGIDIGISTAIIAQTRVLDVLSLVMLSMPAIIFSEKTNQMWLYTTVIISAIIISVPLGIIFIDKNRNISNLLDKIIGVFNNKYINLAIKGIKITYEAYWDIVSNRNLLFIFNYCKTYIIVYIIERTIIYYYRSIICRSWSSKNYFIILACSTCKIICS